MPDVVGETEADATATLTGVNLDVAVDRVFDQDADEGTVIALRERTEPGWWRPQETITMVVSVGAFPDVVGDTREDATAALDAVNVTVATADEYSDDVETGRVIRVQEREGRGAWQPRRHRDSRCFARAAADRDPERGWYDAVRSRR